MIDISLQINGKPVQLSIEPRETLIYVLRNRLGLTGTKHSCDMQVCGACTVLVGDRPVSSCTFLAYDARDKEVTTIEGLARDGRLHPVQQAFIDENGFQCGFCTPGMVLAAKVLLDQNPNPTDGDIRQHLRGNICRCTGYEPIINAVKRAAALVRGEDPGPPVSGHGHGDHGHAGGDQHGQ